MSNNVAKKLYVVTDVNGDVIRAYRNEGTANYVATEQDNCNPHHGPHSVEVYALISGDLK